MPLKGKNKRNQHFVKQRHFVEVLTHFLENKNGLLNEFCYFQFKNGL